MKALLNKSFDTWTEEHKVASAMIFGWVMGVIIALLAVVFFSSMAWADNWHNCSNSGAICDGQGKCTCLGESIKEKGYCPHCGAKGDPMSNVRFSAEKNSYAVYFCPNGHIFNEKE